MTGEERELDLWQAVQGLNDTQRGNTKLIGDLLRHLAHLHKDMRVLDKQVMALSNRVKELESQ